MSIELDTADAVELTELLDWLTEFFTTTNPAVHHAFNDWAANTDAIAELTNDLQRWTNQLRTTIPT